MALLMIQYIRSGEYLCSCGEWIETTDREITCPRCTTVETDTDGKIRLACVDCDCDDCDGIREIGVALLKGWTWINEIQTYEQSLDTVNCESILDWYTHLGRCPDCNKEGVE